jgi:hypothetical protein
MRIIVTILAIIGGLVVLVIGGCIGCVALVATSVSSAPEHFTRDGIAAAYGPVIEQVHAAAASGSSLTWPETRFDDRLVAIFEVESRAEDFHDRYTEIYRRHPVEKTSHSLWNGAGSVGLTRAGLSADYAAYQVEVGAASYLLCFEDWHPAPEPGADPR